MEEKKYDAELEELIRMSAEIPDEPSLQLNNRLKAALYEQEAVLRRQQPVRSFSLWYLPMILNLLIFCLLAVAALLMIANPYLSKLAAGICIYFSLAGVFITILGIRRTKLKEEITLRMKKRGATA